MKSKLLCMLLSFALLCPLICISPRAQERASLFIGDDEWNNDSLMPFIETGEKKLVPAAVFGEFSGITVTQSDSLGSLLIASEDKYLSYNLNFGTCIDETGAEEKTDIYSYGGALYLAPEPVCEKFLLEFETAYAHDGYLAARITDGNEELTFEELLAYYASNGQTTLPYLYNPTGKTVAGLFMYPYILLPAAANIEAVLPLIGSHSVTFAVLPENITAYANIIPKIYAAGHTIAFYMNREGIDAPEEFRTKMEEANSFLFAFIGKTARVYVSTEAYQSIPDIDGYFAKSCRMNLIAGDLTDDYAVNITLMNSPAANVYNFSLASDRQTRVNYRAFFRKFDSFKELRAMPANEASPIN